MNIFLDANICLDLLDTKRPTSKKSIDWYMKNKDNEDITFYFSSDFITTFYYILTQKRKIDSKYALNAIEQLSNEIVPHYIIHNDFLVAKSKLYDDTLDDFEDLLVLSSASRLGCKEFITNDKELLSLKIYDGIKIVSP